MKNVLEKRLILFDVDGTLIDSEKDVVRCFNHILKTNLNFEITHEEFKKLAGLTLEQSFEKSLPEDKKYLVAELTRKYRHYYIDEKHSLDTTTLYEGVHETLETLKKQGFILVIASSKAQRALDPIIEKFNMIDFDLIIGTGQSNFKHKPDPEIIYYALEKFNISKEDAVMVGDTKVDIMAGKNAGIDTIVLTYGYDTKESIISHQPTHIIDDFKELTNLIKFKE